MADHADAPCPSAVEPAATARELTMALLLDNHTVVDATLKPTWRDMDVIMKCLVGAGRRGSYSIIYKLVRVPGVLEHPDTLKAYRLCLEARKFLDATYFCPGDKWRHKVPPGLQAMHTFIAHCRGGRTGKVKEMLPVVNPAFAKSACLAAAVSGSGSHDTIRALLADPRVDPAANGSDCLLQTQCWYTIKPLLEDGRVRLSGRLEDFVAHVQNNVQLAADLVAYSRSKGDGVFAHRMTCRAASYMAMLESIAHPHRCRVESSDSESEPKQKSGKP